MHHDRLKHMKETLMCAVEMQLCDLGEVDTKELGEAIDMIKDLEEAIYYCTVTEAMNNSAHEMEFEMKKGDNHQKDENRMYYGGSYYPMMYADDGRRRRSDGTFYAEDGGRNYMDGSGGGHGSHSGGMNYSDSSMPRDSREGRSYMSRRMYLEAKENNRDKSIQLRELEKYMQELSQDMTEMIADSSPEERQYMEKKMTALASKIGAMK